MQVIINPDQDTSAPFTIPAGKQITIFAAGLGEGEYVKILLATITPGSPMGGICCPGPVELPGLGLLYPLNRVCCGCEETPVQLTRENPWYVLREPQGVPMIAHVVAAADAVITVSMAVTENNGSCEQAPCPGCPPVTIAVTAFTQTTATVAITGGPAIVTMNGVEQYGDGPFTLANLEPGKQYVASVVSDCGSKATVAVTTEPPPPCPEVTVTVTDTTQTTVSVTITGGPAEVVVGGDRQSGNGPFTFAGLTPAKFYTVFATNDCGKKGSATAQTLAAGDFCASIPAPWPSRGFLFHPNDARDPAATVNVVLEGVTYGFGYPNPGPGHTSAVLNKEGVVQAYATNTSDCAPPCPCEPVDICAEIAKCPQPTVVFNNAGANYGGGICAQVFSDPNTPVGELLILQSRNNQILTNNGHAISSAPNAVVVAVVENPFDVPSLCELMLVGHANQGATDTPATGFSFLLSENVNAPPPPYTGLSGRPIMPNASYVQLNPRQISGYWGFPEVTDPEAPFHPVPVGVNETAGPAMLTIQLQPRETRTFYGQWWAFIPNPFSTPDGPFIATLHGAMYLSYKVTRGGINIS